MGGGGGCAPPRRDPLVLDLDGNGIKTISLDQGVHFDYNGDGFSEGTGWVAQGDGLLVLDRNGDGQITNGSELFGDGTLLRNGRTASNGFEALADYDSNNDGVIDATDPVFSQLRVDRRKVGSVGICLFSWPLAG
jgi:hypothetical protein